MRAVLIFGLFLAFAGVVRGEDAVELLDGRVIRGALIGDEADSVTLRVDGEDRPILKTRIKRIVRHPSLKAPAQGAPADPFAPRSGASADPATLQIVQELGAPQLERRRTAMEVLVRTKEKSVPVLLASLAPQQKTSEFARLDIIRTLVKCSPLSDSAAQTLAYCAVFDPYPEVRREAAITIRRLQDDRSLREVLRYASSTTPGHSIAAAAALREIDDDRVLASLVRTLPAPTTTANYGEPTGLDKPKYTIPTGPGGLNMPIFLPSQPVAGVAADLDSPVHELLRRISGKNFGPQPYGWFNWFSEKVGDRSIDDYLNDRERRSLRSRMNSR